MYRALFLDINAIGYSCMYQPALREMACNGFPTAALHGALSSLRVLMREYPEAVPLVLWDGAHNWREAGSPEYKAGRHEGEERQLVRHAYKLQVPYLRKLFLALGIPQIYHSDLEADDLAGKLAACASQMQVPSLCVTKDSDWWQAISEYVHFMHFQTKAIFTPQSIFGPDNEFDDAEQYVIAKSLAGDGMDGIAGINKVGLVVAVKMLRRFGSLEALYAAFEGRGVDGVNHHGRSDDIHLGRLDGDECRCLVGHG